MSFCGGQDVSFDRNRKQLKLDWQAIDAGYQNLMRSGLNERGSGYVLGQREQDCSEILTKNFRR
jgi:hypothetical protein